MNRSDNTEIKGKEMEKSLWNNIRQLVRSASMIVATAAVALSASAQDIPVDGLFTKKYISAFDYDALQGTLTLENFVTGEMKLSSEPFDVIMILDVSGSMSGKIDKLQNGAIAVLDQIYESNTSTSGTSRLGIVTFGQNDEVDTRVIHKISAVNSSNYSTIKSNIQNIKDGGSTQSDLGFELSLEMLRNPSKNVSLDDVDGRELSDYVEMGYTGTPFDRQTFVIFFTDGMPGNSRGEIETGETTLELAYVYKAKGAKVFSIGLFDSDPAKIWIEEDDYEKALNVKDYLEHVSSLYNTVKEFDWGEDYVEWTPSNPVRNTDGIDYYLRVDNVNKLAETFASICSQIIGVASKSLTAEAVVKDIISTECSLPNGIQTTDIKVYSAPCTGGNSTAGFTFGSKGPETATVTISDKNVSVTGFDYGANWVGISGDTYHGKKLIVEIPFLVNPAVLATKTLNGIQTNDANSGLYESPDAVGPVQTYTIPTVPDVNVTVKASGLHKDESAVFRIEQKKPGETSFSLLSSIILTGTADAGTAVSITFVNKDPSATYKVTEMTGWNLTYTPQQATEQTKTKPSTGNEITFEFGHTKNDSGLEIVEKAIDNLFNP